MDGSVGNGVPVDRRACWQVGEHAGRWVLMLAVGVLAGGGRAGRWVGVRAGSWACWQVSGRVGRWTASERVGDVLVGARSRKGSCSSGYMETG